MLNRTGFHISLIVDYLLFLSTINGETYLKGKTMVYIYTKRVILMRTIWVLALLITTIMVSGCGQRCGAPYKLIGDTCCIDDDNSGVCDLEEFEAKMAEQKQAEPTTQEKIAPQPQEIQTKEISNTQESPESPETTTQEPETTETTTKEPESAKTQTNQDQIPQRIHSLVPSIEPENDTVPKYVLDRPKQLDFKLTNLKYGHGKLQEVDVSIKNNMDFDVSPRIKVYAIQDGEYKKVAEMLYKDLDPGKTRTVPQDNIGVDIDDENTEVVFEFLYHSASTGLVKVGERNISLEE